jgi:hypothetical protein
VSREQSCLTPTEPVHLTSEKLPQRRGSFCFLVDFLLESLENLFKPEDLIEMGISLDGSLAVETH